MALVLTRNAGQKIQIGDDVTITLLNIGERQARIAIDAPQHIQITRPDMKKGKPDAREG